LSIYLRRFNLAGCVSPTLPNGTVDIINNAGGGMQNGVYRANTTINYNCSVGYYLSTLTVVPLGAICVISGTNIGSWSTNPSCLRKQITQLKLNSFRSKCLTVVSFKPGVRS